MNSFNKLRTWLKVKNDNLRMLEKNSRGLYSIKDIKKDDIIMQIPSKYLIELSTVIFSLSRFYSDKLIVENITYNFNFKNNNSIIASYLLLENLNKKSKWKKYLDTFPKDLSEYIHYYKKDKMQLLKNSSIMCKESTNIKNIIEEIISDAEIFYQFLKNINELPKDYSEIKNFIKLFMKFRIYVDSRNFNYTKYNNSEYGLVPYADLLNHSNKPNTNWYFDDKKDSFIVQATEDISKNTEISDSYGSKSNIIFVIYYGFSIKNNPYSNLTFIYKNNLIILDKKSDLESILYEYNLYKYKKHITKLLGRKLLLHTQNIKKTDDYNIKNLLNDEIMIIKKMLR